MTTKTKQRNDYQDLRLSRGMTIKTFAAAAASNRAFTSAVIRNEHREHKIKMTCLYSGAQRSDSDSRAARRWGKAALSNMIWH